MSTRTPRRIVVSFKNGKPDPDCLRNLTIYCDTPAVFIEDLGQGPVQDDERERLIEAYDEALAEKEAALKHAERLEELRAQDQQELHVLRAKINAG